MIKKLLFIVALLIFSTANAEDKIFLELFTSQGCPACPPADNFLGELVKRRDVIALGCHVDYWDNRRKDPYSLKYCTNRQKNYKANANKIYTPQIITGGLLSNVGSDYDGVNSSIQRLKNDQKYVDLEIKDGKAIIKPRVTFEDFGFEVLIFYYLPETVTQVGIGRNRGQVFNYNVVTDIIKLSDWDGKPAEIKFDIGNAKAILVIQEHNQGKVIAAKEIN